MSIQSLGDGVYENFPRCMVPHRPQPIPGSNPIRYLTHCPDLELILPTCGWLSHEMLLQPMAPLKCLEPSHHRYAELTPSEVEDNNLFSFYRYVHLHAFLNICTALDTTQRATSATRPPKGTGKPQKRLDSN